MLACIGRDANGSIVRFSGSSPIRFAPSSWRPVGNSLNVVTGAAT